MPGKVAKVNQVKHVTILIAYLLVVWGFYRQLVELPEEIEELLVKPVLWLVPVIYLVSKEKSGLKSLGLSLSDFFKNAYIAIALGALFVFEALLVNYVKYGGLSWGANIGTASFWSILGITLATAVVEELTFRGYIFSRLLIVFKGEWTANVLTSVSGLLLHLPIAVFKWQMALGELLPYAVVVFLFSLGAGFIFARTKNVYTAILLHVLWQWPIILFR